MSDKAKFWLIVLAVLFVLGIIVQAFHHDPSDSSGGGGSTCEQLWAAGKDSTLSGYTHDSYISFCNNIAQQGQQFQQEHGTTP